jgi:hypothetical protein
METYWLNLLGWEQGQVLYTEQHGYEALGFTTCGETSWLAGEVFASQGLCTMMLVRHKSWSSPICNCLHFPNTQHILQICSLHSVHATGSQVHLLELKMYPCRVNIANTTCFSTQIVSGRWNKNVHSEVNTLRTGDANLRHLRFCVTTVKDGWRKIAF